MESLDIKGQTTRENGRPKVTEVIGLRGV